MNGHDDHMDCDGQHLMWLKQVERLKVSMGNLSQTEPCNVLQHFFLQAAESELSTELEDFKNLIKVIITDAIKNGDQIQGTHREKSCQILKKYLDIPILSHIRLTDIRNRAVFEIYQRCGITVDTYFDRYSSPPGNASQNEIYGNIAHGDACASANITKTLSKVLSCVQILKRVFMVQDMVKGIDSIPSECNLNWLGAMWACHIQKHSLGDLIWELFLDLWKMENINL